MHARDASLPCAFRGWPVSPYTMKVRADLRFKRIPRTDRPPTRFALRDRIEKAAGHPIMPTVVTPDGTWSQDPLERVAFKCVDRGAR